MAKKNKKEIIYFCDNCGYESSKWLGQCPICKEWNTFVEQKIDSVENLLDVNDTKTPITIDKININDEERFSSGFDEFDNLLGGGIVKGSMCLIGGQPGIGKSTLMLQIARNVGKDREVLYISGEENLSQIKLRAKRLGDFTSKVKFVDETNISKIITIVSKYKPELLIIDSIQTISTDGENRFPGSISEVRNSANLIFKLSKELNISTFIIGHITKDGNVAGPKILEHLVDTVLYFEDDQFKNYNLLRCVKNRFGSNKELAVFEMKKEGLKEIKNVSEIFLDGRPEDASGCVITCTVDSGKIIFIEVQSLVTKSQFGMAKRNINGGDYNRLGLLIAIIEKRLNLPLYEYDIYINITGGLKIKDTSIDLAIIMAIISSYKNVALGSDCVYCGEVGLSGEVRNIKNVDMIIKEATKLGYKNIFLPKVAVENLPKDYIEKYKNINIKSISNIMR